MGERLAVIRTADLGTDKQAPYLDIPQETNPIMATVGFVSVLTEEECLKHNFVQFIVPVRMVISQ